MWLASGDDANPFLNFCQQLLLILGELIIMCRKRRSSAVAAALFNALGHVQQAGTFTGSDEIFNYEQEWVC